MSYINENLIISLIVGIGLSAACSFRVFIPVLVMGIAAKAGQIRLAENFLWIASTPAIIAFSAASIFEILAYYIPWFDNLMDNISTPASVIAGTILTSSLILDISPFLRWTLAIIAGGAVAGTVQASTVLARGASSVFTAGLGNFFISTIELILSIVISVLAVCIPLIALCLLILILWKISGLISKKIISKNITKNERPAERLQS